MSADRNILDFPGSGRSPEQLGGEPFDGPSAKIFDLETRRTSSEQKPEDVLFSDEPVDAKSDFDPGEVIAFDGESKVGRGTFRWQVLVPENRRYDGIAYYKNGLSGIYGSSLVPAQAIANQGIVVARLELPRRGNSRREDMFAPQKVHVESFDAAGQDIAEHTGIMELLSGNIDLDKRLLLGYSMGNQSALLEARRHASRTHIAFSLAGTGYYHPTLSEIMSDAVSGGVPMLRHDVLNTLLGGGFEPTIENARDLFHYWRKARVIAEIVSCLTYNVIPVAEKARELGVKTAHQAYQHDALVRPDARVAQLVDFHEVLPNVGHFAPMRKARTVAERVANFVLSV